MNGLCKLVSTGPFIVETEDDDFEVPERLGLNAGEREREIAVPTAASVIEIRAKDRKQWLRRDVRMRQNQTFVQVRTQILYL